MRQTTVRFGEDLWAELEEEAAGLGISIAQYLREAALTRLVYARGRRGDEGYEAALHFAGTEPARSREEAEPVDRARHASEAAAATTTASEAVWAQARQARARATELRGRHTRTS